MTFAMCLAIFGTNQFHKWAHMDTPPWYAQALQRANLILPPEHHAVHHTSPYAKYYCITVGWLNEGLFRLRFFQILEKIIAHLTGLIPREDDIGKRAALVVAQQPPPPLPDLPKMLTSMELPLDLRTLGIPLDNVEGMTLGPTLPDGRRSLVMVSDNNFAASQFTQFLLFAVS